MTKFRMAMMAVAFGTAVGFSQTTKPDTKPGDKKADVKPVETKPTTAKPVETKPATTAKPVETKPADTKPVETKPAAGKVEVKPTLIEEGRKPKVGISTRNTPQGAMVTGVMPDSPAHKAGLEIGDVIISIDGFTVGIVDGMEYPVQSEIRRIKGSGKFKIVSRRNPGGAAVDVEIKLEK